MGILKEIVLDNIILAILAVFAITSIGVFAVPDAEAGTVLSYGITAIAGLATGKTLSK